MNKQTMGMQAKLLCEVTESVGRINHIRQHDLDDDAAVRENLTRMWDVTQELERRLAKPEIVAGYRRDALRQLDRVKQLIGEAPDPDERQLLSIAMAGEMALEKISHYLKMDRHAAMQAVVSAAMEA